MLKEIVIAFQSYGQAHRFIREHRLWKWILIPGILYMLLFVTGMYFFWQSSNDAVSWLSQNIWERWLKKENSEILSFLFVMAGLILRLVLLLFYFSLFKFLFLIVGSPLFAYLSEKTESILEGKDYPFSWKQLLIDIWRGTRIALRNALWQTVYTVSLLLLSLIPIVGWITPVIALSLECFYYGFSMLDYSCERARLTPAQSIDFITRHRGLAIGNGFLFYLMHAVPFAGWVLAPAYAVVAATMSVYRIKQSGA
ncbi:CysZ protein [Cnuella takakiae]|uniref:CysZ protein n=1 Tax=Cnuella takakiae TaxID=1302690 RepID=A0A1M5J718_9BACT|nr:EI24 domain-containing protein [Cnuella takakiae]OLY91463.1 hypothetical protein BUE76_05775 [Cnuella takakiae]SHG36030.1 CysZ protein [Cnuella takakiae]